MPGHPKEGALCALQFFRLPGVRIEYFPVAGHFGLLLPSAPLHVADAWVQQVDDQVGQEDHDGNEHDDCQDQRGVSSGDSLHQ